MTLPGDDAALTEARENAWQGLRERFGYPKWVEKLHRKMLLWLDGEGVVYAEYGWERTLDGERSAASVGEAAELWVFVLTDHFALSVGIEKLENNTSAGRVTRWELVKRSEIVELDAEFPPEVQERLGLTLKVEYNGISRKVIIPEQQPIEPPADGRRGLFVALRDDYFAD